jgi:hypothetical protein
MERDSSFGKTLAGSQLVDNIFLLEKEAKSTSFFQAELSAKPT